MVDCVKFVIKCQFGQDDEEIKFFFVFVSQFDYVSAKILKAKKGDHKKGFG